jgi:hypothetical protein
MAHIHFNSLLVLGFFCIGLGGQLTLVGAIGVQFAMSKHHVSSPYMAMYKAYVRDNLFPIANRLKLILEFSTDTGVKLGGWYEFQQVGIETHLSRG